MIPIYVGLQAPVELVRLRRDHRPPRPPAQGTAAAQDAVVDAQAIGMGAGNPIYFDMEAYNRTSSQHHRRAGLPAGVDASCTPAATCPASTAARRSGIADLVGAVRHRLRRSPTSSGSPTGTTSRAPPTRTSRRPTGPPTSACTSTRARHNETYGGATINIDGDYLDGATAAAGTGSGVDATPTVAPAPSLGVTVGPDGSTGLTPTWTEAAGVVSWQMIGGSSPTSFTYAAPAIAAGAPAAHVTKNSFPYWEVQALDATGQVLGTSPAIATPAHVMIFGNSAFAPKRGLGAVPFGCVGVSSCAVTTTISSGRTTFATTKREFIPAGGGLAYFTLTSAAQTALAKAHNHQLAVNVRCASRRARRPPAS